MAMKDIALSSGRYSSSLLHSCIMFIASLLIIVLVVHVHLLLLSRLMS